MRLFGWLRTRWYCPMCGGEVRKLKPTIVQEEHLGFDRPSAPCPHCGYDPYEPMAESRWRRRQEDQAQPLREELDEDTPPEGVDPDSWRQIVRDAQQARADLDKMQAEERDDA